MIVFCPASCCFKDDVERFIQYDQNTNNISYNKSRSNLNQQSNQSQSSPITSSSSSNNSAAYQKLRQNKYCSTENTTCTTNANLTSSNTTTNNNSIGSQSQNNFENHDRRDEKCQLIDQVIKTYSPEKPKPPVRNQPVQKLKSISSPEKNSMNMIDEQLNQLTASIDSILKSSTTDSFHFSSNDNSRKTSVESQRSRNSRNLRKVTPPRIVAAPPNIPTSAYLQPTIDTIPENQQQKKKYPVSPKISPRNISYKKNTPRNFSIETNSTINTENTYKRKISDVTVKENNNNDQIEEDYHVPTVFVRAPNSDFVSNAKFSPKNQNNRNNNNNKHMGISDSDGHISQDNISQTNNSGHNLLRQNSVEILDPRKFENVPLSPIHTHNPINQHSNSYSRTIISPSMTQKSKFTHFDSLKSIENTYNLDNSKTTKNADFRIIGEEESEINSQLNNSISLQTDLQVEVIPEDQEDEEDLEKGSEESKVTITADNLITEPVYIESSINQANSHQNFDNLSKNSNFSKPLTKRSSNATFYTTRTHLTSQTRNTDNQGINSLKSLSKNSSSNTNAGLVIHAGPVQQDRQQSSSRLVDSTTVTETSRATVTSVPNTNNSTSTSRILSTSKLFETTKYDEIEDPVMRESLRQVDQAYHNMVAMSFR